MTDNLTTVDAPVTFEIKEKIVNKGYVDADGKFVQTDGDVQVEGAVQLPQDLN